MTIKDNEDLLNNGTFSCYSLRFILAFLLGVFIEIILVAFLLTLRYTVAGQFDQTISRFSNIAYFVINYWIVILLWPFFTGIYGIFKFDSLKKMYINIHDFWISQCRK